MSTVEAREDEPIIDRTAAPMAAVRKRWVRVSAISLVGALLGVLVGLLIPTSQTAEVRVAVGQGSLTTSAIAGFPLAAVNLASNYARYVNSTGVAREATMPGVKLKASQIPESNVIRIEATSKNAEDATAAATAAADELIAQVNDESIQREIKDTRDALAAASQQYSDAFARVQSHQAELIRLQAPPVATVEQRDGARNRLAEAKGAEGIAEAELNAQQTKLVRLISENSQAAKLTLVREVGKPTSSRSSNMQIGGLLGLVVGGAVGVISATASARRRGQTQG
ncbi:MAG: hypothetical protein Q4G46_01770 [Propionibacteriaceae bacterium]|nr:hypothetical protein [Propionibacteriaceae bacterium]